MHDFLWENSWTYRQSVELGIEKSRREDIVIFVETRFPALTKLAKEKVADIHSKETLRKVLIAMYSAETEQKVQRYLLTLKSKKKWLPSIVALTGACERDD